MSGKYKILWGISILAIFLETYRQFMSVSILFRSFIYFILWMLLCFVFANKLIRRINYIPIILFLIVVLLYFLRGGDYENFKTTSNVISLAICYIIYPTLYLYYRKYCSPKEFTICLIIVVVATTYTMICTIPVAMLKPGLIRETASNLELYFQLQRLGVMNYALPHSVIFLIPALCFGMKYCYSKWIRFFCFLFFLETFMIVYMSEATTPLLLGLLSFFISLIYNAHKNLRINVIRIAFVSLFLVVLMNESVILSILNILEPIFEGTAFEHKLHELEMSLAMESVSGADVEARQTLIDDTIAAIINNPIFGTTNSKLLGGHNYLLDIWASIGLVGLIPLMIWLFYIFKKILFTLRDCCRPYYFFGISTFFLHALTKNIWSDEFFFFSFFVEPCVLIYLGEKCDSEEVLLHRMNNKAISFS